jgi:DNA-binding CsgD family transcriptional regulator
MKMLSFDKDFSLKSSLSLISVMFLLFSLSIFIDLYVIYFASSKIQEYAKYIEFSVFMLGLVIFIINIKLQNTEKKLKVNHALEIEKIMNERGALTKTKNFESILDVHLNVWSLTEAEKVVALHLLKGLTSKEISDLRNVSEKTIRNQSHSIYSKSGLSGKHELAAYFLKEFLVK